ncbi:MAG: PIN domain-containing protein [Haloarculaceae archaeon]
MSSGLAKPVFVDTGAVYAGADEDDGHHEDATHLFDGIRSGEMVYRPLYTSQAVLSEFATLALDKLGHGTAASALGAIRGSVSINVIPVGEPAFETAAAQYENYDDQQISFVDHTTSILAEERDIEHVFGFDSDVSTMGFTLIPEAGATSQE